MSRRLRVTRMHMMQAAVLLIVVMMSWGKRMGSSLMSPLKSTLKYELGINNTQWASLISMVWVVGTVSPFIAGLMIDMMGAPLAGALAILLILVGNGVCAVAVGSRHLGVFLAGRAIYSLGGGAVLLVGEVILFKWFKGRQLPVAFGCLATMSGLMAFSGPATVTAVLSKNQNITIPFWLATGLSAFGLLCFGVYGIIHNSDYARQADQRSIGPEDSETEADFESAHSFVSRQQLDGAKPSASFGDKHGLPPSLRDSSSISAVNSVTDTAAALAKADQPQPVGFMARAAAKTKHLLARLAALPEPYWFVLLCISIQGTLFIPLHEIVPEMVETEWGYTRAESSKLFVYLHIIPIALHGAIGVLINRVGHRLSLFLAGSAIVFLASIFITFARKVPVVLSLAMMNISGSLVPASIFSLTNLVIDNGEVAGAALGLIRSAEFASVTLMEMLDGLLQDANHNSYDTVLIGLVVFAGLLLFVGIVSIIVDHRANGGRLNSADPYTSPVPDAPGHSTEELTTLSTAVAASSKDGTVLMVCQEQRRPAIPTRRYAYMCVIGLLLGTSWALFIVLLAKA
ncbi:hypothetical protein GGF46_004308 [Coemansia sp. RSA 552]|nr:hypothetical protein GGF46_004308 [Coemansia sp. RSA 552]